MSSTILSNSVHHHTSSDEHFCNELENFSASEFPCRKSGINIPQFFQREERSYDEPNFHGSQSILDIEHRNTIRNKIKIEMR